MREASLGPNNAYTTVFSSRQCQSLPKLSDPESLETCQGDLLSCIEMTADKASAESQRGRLLLLGGCGATLNKSSGRRLTRHQMSLLLSICWRREGSSFPSQCLRLCEPECVSAIRPGSRHAGGI